MRTNPDSERLAEETGIDAALCYFHRPGSREAESYRNVRTTLFHSLPAGKCVIQLTSAEPGDGKSVTTANLAVAIAQSGKNVLLIDGDVRQPKVHKLFGVAQGLGLSDVLHGDIVMNTAIKQSRIPGLLLLTSGDCPANPAELLSAANLDGLLQSAKREFDVVIIDSPPVLAVSDPSIIAPSTDGVLLVVRMQKNNSRDTRSHPRHSRDARHPHDRRDRQRRRSHFPRRLQRGSLRQLLSQRLPQTRRTKVDTPYQPGDVGRSDFLTPAPVEDAGQVVVHHLVPRVMGNPPPVLRD